MVARSALAWLSPGCWARRRRRRRPSRSSRKPSRDRRNRRPWRLPHTLQEALALAYATNPTLQTARAQLRATDENVPTALAGWRPQVVLTGTIGRGFGTSETKTANSRRSTAS